MQNKEKNINLMITVIYSLVALIYFANAVYSYFYKIEGEVIINIALGIMFLSLGVVYKLPNKK